MTKISGIEISSGTSRPLESAASDQCYVGVVERLKADGFEIFLENETDIAEICKESMSKTLASTGVNPGDIDAVFFATESIWDKDIERIRDDQQCEDHLRMRNGLMSVMSELGLAHAYPYGVWMAACNNLGSAFSLADGLIKAGHHKRILLVVGERHNRHLPRFTRSGSSIYSDLVASCILDAESEGFEILNVTLSGSTKIAQLYRDDQEAFKLLETNRALKRLRIKFEENTRFVISDFNKVVIANYHIDQLKTICNTLTIDPSRLLREYRSTLAHGYSMDTLASLKFLKEDGLIEKGDYVLLVNTAIEMWSLVSIRVE